MDLNINIPKDGSLWCYHLLPFGDYQRIDCEGVVIFDIWKIHNHRYEMHAFFYSRKIIVPLSSFSTKRELYGAMQKLLQEYL